MESIQIAFEPSHLTEEELRYELKIRNIVPVGNLRSLTKKLREYLIKENKGIFMKPVYTEDVSSEVSHINLHLEELDISMMVLENVPNNKEIIQALISRFVHIDSRLQRIAASNNPNMVKEVEKLNIKIKNNLKHLEGLKMGKSKSQADTLGSELEKIDRGPKSGASDVMADSYLNLASGIQAPIHSTIPVSFTFSTTSSVGFESGNRIVGAIPKTSIYTSPPCTNIISSQRPISSAVEFTAGRGRGSCDRQINRSLPRPPFNDYYQNHTYIPPVSSNSYLHSVSVNNENSSFNYNPPYSNSNFIRQPSFYQTQPQVFSSVSQYYPTVTSSNYSNINLITQPNTMTVPINVNHPPIRNLIRQPEVHQNQFLNHMVGGVDEQEMLQRPFYNRNPVSGWNLFFSGEPNSRSLYDFLSRIEMLARAEHISEEVLRRSAYYLFTGAAMTWYRAFEQNLPTWTDLVNALKNQFIPLDYDRALLREIENRKQGSSESFGMYLANMEMLYRGIQRTNIPEIVKLDTIMRNMLPYLTEKLMLTDINTIVELSTYCRKIENTQFRLAQMNLPNDHKYLLEPQFSYKTSGNERKDAVPRQGGQYPRKY